MTRTRLGSGGSSVVLGRRVGGRQAQLDPQLVQDLVGPAVVDLSLQVVDGDLHRIRGASGLVGRGQRGAGVGLGLRHDLGDGRRQGGDRLVDHRLAARRLAPAEHRQPGGGHRLQAADVLTERGVELLALGVLGRDDRLPLGDGGAGVAQAHGEDLGCAGQPGRVGPLAGTRGFVGADERPLCEGAGVLDLGGGRVEADAGLDPGRGQRRDAGAQGLIVGGRGGHGVLELTLGVGRVHRDAVGRPCRRVPRIRHWSPLGRSGVRGGPHSSDTGWQRVYVPQSPRHGSPVTGAPRPEPPLRPAIRSTGGSASRRGGRRPPAAASSAARRRAPGRRCGAARGSGAGSPPRRTAAGGRR